MSSRPAGMACRACAALLVLFVAGCAARPATFDDPIPQQDVQRPQDLRPYLRADRLGRWVYERRKGQWEDNDDPAEYVRIVNRRRLSEGRLHGSTMPPLERYMQLPDTDETEPAERRDRPRRTLPYRGTLFLFRLDEPMPAIPLELAEQGRVIHTTVIRYYDRRGQQAAEGILTRLAEIEGIESVQCPAGEFPDCLRVRVELKARFPWGIGFDWISRLWLSADAGEVRRAQEMSGWILIFPFRSAHEYRLVSHDPLPTTAPANIAAPAWRDGLVIMDRGVPSPQIGGMVVDFAEPQAPPALARED